ncbi:hypothetical protein QMZ92_09605 [Streptomyces sp. HNM0645]|uniref:hypothetical protein n=1 Tax=Streptomyces sp. HNM0645 TaxID=2782343 RepID=UPI0024B84BC0|nr:hypothetical protein [Streptomyces sp. HNM0645]MDI9884645.1 hypothetical protein [Streptomyces sp. HNM0645]
MVADAATLFLHASANDDELLLALALKTGKERRQRAFPHSSADAPAGDFTVIADPLYYPGQGRRLFVLCTSVGGYAGPFYENDNKIRGAVATAEGVYATGVNHRLVHVPAGEFTWPPVAWRRRETDDMRTERIAASARPARRWHPGGFAEEHAPIRWPDDVDQEVPSHLRLRRT